MANLSRASSAASEDDEEEEGGGISLRIPRFLGRQNNQ
jgi:cell division protein FtsZ